MKKLIHLIILFYLFINFSFSQNKDSIEVRNIKYEIQRLETQLNTVEKNQLNYSIEKDLIRETYSSNYERISLIITIILGIIGVIGYLGIKDINTIKKEYITELEKLKGLQVEFKSKSKEFNIEKSKFDSEIRKILLENENQNKKIKFIELKEKIKNFLIENKLIDALEFIGVAHELSPENETILEYKARTLCRLNKLEDSLSVNKELYEKFETKKHALNLIECMYFAKDYNNLKPLLEKYKVDLEEKNEGKVSKIFNLFKLYHTNQKDKIIRTVKEIIDFNDLDTTSKRITEWDLTEAKFVAQHLPDSTYKNQIQNVIWYCDGQINGKNLCDRLKIEIAEKK
ncbi:hypothetical protein [Olleya marilimosa]|uniref:hypothetical protein n=1 Tax=Olleya marilimosa TaxID=272164 RepID=UPI00168D1B9A|nr:hypothetical protein [Olleya marilimosa]MBD3892209.1 hypothetical protein [Olleya marilimosa]